MIRTILSILALSSLANVAMAAGPTYSCSGTEPFWSVTMSPTGVSLEVLGEGTKALFLPATARGAAGRESYAFVFRSNSETNRNDTITVAITRGNCSDGMSENTYSFSGVVITKNAVFAGCCSAK